MDAEKKRADATLVCRGLAASRERAQSLIASGLALCNGVPIAKPSARVNPDDILTVTGEAIPYVSRGGLKLEKALKVFHVDPTGAVCADIGASTGGFTDVLLQNGARHVYAVDVGSGQLDPRLAADPRVTNLEHINARALTSAMFPEQPTLAVMDVSFISIKLILPSLLTLLGGDGRALCLVKPQFEAGRRRVGKRGIVSDPDAHAEVLQSIVGFMPALGWRVQGLDFSPIAGGDGNLEFLADLAPEGRSHCEVTLDGIDDLVRRAHATLTKDKAPKLHG